MQHGLQIHRRKSRRTPMRTRRVGVALYAPAASGAAAEDFPGLDLDAPDSARGRAVSNGVSALVHAGLIALLALGAYLAPVEEIEELIELQRIDDVLNEPGPAPRVVQERAVPRFDPSRMAVAPQVVNPVVIRRAAPVVQARKLDVDTINTVQAPREVARSAAVVEQARAYQSPVVATTQPVEIEGVAPAIRGPIEHVAPVGVQSGPRQVASVGNTAGIADPEALGDGSALREGIVGGRDVLGAKTGERAQVHWAVGDHARGRGGGGDGSGLGGGSVSFQDCQSRPEVQRYLRHVHDRMKQRWALPTDVRPDMQVVLRFVLDPAGTASRVELVRSEDPRFGESAVVALRSASPFDPMPDPVRCLAGGPLVATFRNPLATATN